MEQSFDDLNSCQPAFEVDTKIIDSPWQQLLPDNIVLEIFLYLETKDLICVSETCKSWWRIAQDEFLWKKLLYRKCGTSNAPLPQGKTSWSGEYKRLCYNVPCIASETLDGHCDEVYHVGFSSSGKMFSTVGRDGTVKIWKLGFPTRLYGSLNLKLKSPANDYTRFSEFNSSETLLLVACLVGQGLWSRDGLIIIASVKPEPDILYAVETDFTNFRGAWFDDNSFLNATVSHSMDYRETFCLKQHRVSVASKPINFKSKSYVDVIDASTRKGETVLQLHQDASGSHDFIRVVDCVKLRRLMSDITTVEHETKHSSSDDVENGSNPNIDEIKDKTYFSASSSNDGETDNPFLNEKYEKIVFMAQDCYESESGKTVGDIVFYNLPSCSDLKNSGYDEETNESGSDDELNMSHQQSDKVKGQLLKKLCLQVGILGLYLSKDQRYLVYNYRPLEEKEENGHFHVYSKDMEIRVYDLLLGRDTGMIFKGHRAEHSHNSLSYIFPSISQDYVASGSENTSAFLWDFHYGNFLSTVQHSRGNSADGVNAVAFSPTDQEVLVTVGDDYKVRVWRSKQRIKELSNQKSDKDETRVPFCAGISVKDNKKKKITRTRSIDKQKSEDDDEESKHIVACCCHKWNTSK